MEESLGVKSPEKSQLMILAGPVGPYYPSGFNPISLSCATETVRSSHKGTGSFKIGGYLALYQKLLSDLDHIEVSHRQGAPTSTVAFGGPGHRGRGVQHLFRVQGEKWYN